MSSDFVKKKDYGQYIEQYIVFYNNIVYCTIYCIVQIFILQYYIVEKKILQYKNNSIFPSLEIDYEILY